MAEKRSPVPFDNVRLDRLMEEADLDVVMATSKHNIQYLTGGHWARFFESKDAIGISRYLPVLLYPKGKPDQAAYFGHKFETNQCAIDPLWMSEVQTKSWGALDGVEAALDYLARRNLPHRRIGVETPFLPVDSGDLLRARVGQNNVINALTVLERLRAIKSDRELALMRQASESVVDAMLAVISRHGGGSTKREITEDLRREETNRGLTFEYCLLTMGSDLNRAPSDQAWQLGDQLSLDSGGNLHGYIGDLARMAVLGDPDSELQALLDEIAAVQDAAISTLRSGVTGEEIFAAAASILERSSHRRYTDFMAHGVGLVTHEAPRMTTKGPIPYPDDDARRPLDSGMVVSIETTMRHPRRGFLKLEDTAAILEGTCEIYGNRGYGWNRGAV